jgi:hypothetical protein
VVVLALGDTYWACLRSSGVKRPLAPGGADIVQGAPVVNGRYVAFQILRRSICEDPSCVFQVVSLNVATGRRLVSNGAFRIPFEPFQLRRLVLDAHGRVAWVIDVHARELGRMDSDGDEILDTGGAIDPASLTITKGRVAWRNGSVQRSAPLDSHPPCSLRNSSTIKRTDEVRVSWLKDPRRPVDGAVIGCQLASGRTTQLGARPLDSLYLQAIDDVQAAGHFATIDRARSRPSPVPLALAVYDLKRGVVVHRWSCCDTEPRRLDSVLLAPNGSVAWTNLFAGVGGYKYEIRKSDAGGNALLLDRSPYGYPGNGIGYRSLTLTGTTLRWTHDGAEWTAQLR